MKRITWRCQSHGRPFYLNRFDGHGGFSYPAHDHEEHWEFVYVVMGSFRHRIGGAARIHEAGRLILIRDADTHSLAGRDFSYVNLAFNPAWIDRYGAFRGRPTLRAELERQAKPPEALVPEAERLALVNRFDALLRAVGELDAGVWAFAVILPLLVSYVEDPVPMAVPSPKAAAASSALAPPPPAWLAGLLSWAAAGERPPSTADFIRKSGYSAEHLIRTMKRHYGTTPSRFLAELRLRRAEELLRYTNYSIERVADESGWTGIRHFERCFAARTGRTPRAFRSANAILAH